MCLRSAREIRGGLVEVFSERRAAEEWLADVTAWGAPGSRANSERAPVNTPISG
jgi:hypothetical protein